MTRGIGEKLDGDDIWQKLQLDIFLKLFQLTFAYCKNYFRWLCMASTGNLKMRVNANIVIMKILISMIYHIILMRI